MSEIFKLPLSFRARTAKLTILKKIVLDVRAIRERALADGVPVEEIPATQPELMDVDEDEEEV